MIGTDRLTPEGEWMAGVLALGPNALLSRESAGSLWRVIHVLVLPVHVTAPTNRRPRRGLIPHRGFTTDRRVRNGIPVTAPARTIAELPKHLRDEARINARVKRVLSPDRDAGPHPCDANAIRARKGDPCGSCTTWRPR